MKKIAVVAGVLSLAVLLVSQTQTPEMERPGPQTDGTTKLVNGWRIRPAGTQIPLSTFPMSSVLTPDNKFVVILNGGYLPPTVDVFEAASMTKVSSIGLPDAWLGLTMTANGRMIYVGGGSRSSVYELALSPEGTIALSRTFVVAPEAGRGWQDFLGDVALSPDGRLIYAAMVFRDEVAVINPQSGMVIERIKTGRRPYRILFNPNGKSFFASSWADAAVYQHRAETGERMGVLRTGPHPTDMVWREKQTKLEEGEEAGFKARLFVAAANTNRVNVFGVGDSNEDVRPLESINISLTPNQPVGMTPSHLALNSDQSRMYVTCSDANAVAVVDVSGKKSRVLGFVPSGWYPTASRSLADGRLVVLNGRGLRSFPNPNGPNPLKRAERSHLGIRQDEYVGVLQQGTASVVPAISEPQLAAFTKTVMNNTPYRDELLQHTGVASAIVPARPGGKTPIEHVIYIIKENRTYDQVLGAIGRGNSDPSLVLFGEEISPNHHKLAREFVLLDNFYVNADVSADGHNWSTAAIANDYVQRIWQNSYAGRLKRYSYEGGEAAALPPAGYIWTNALAAGVSMRNYGWWVDNGPRAETGAVQLSGVRDPQLKAHTSMAYRGFDLDYPDVDRAKVFLAELAEFERNGNLPKLTLIKIGNDHTSGTAAGKVTPQSAVADNDLAFGMIVEAVSKSKFWPKTAIFVLEDDAQNGADHVDSHRAPAYVISPYTRTGKIDSTFYNTTSMLRTIELIVGLNPMTHFDAAARPMTAAFSTSANVAPYAAVRPRHSLTDRNPAGTALAARAAKLKLDEADEIDDDEMNAILWLAVRKSTPPTPVRSYFGR